MGMTRYLQVKSVCCGAFIGKVWFVRQQNGYPLTRQSGYDFAEADIPLPNIVHATEV